MKKLMLLSIIGTTLWSCGGGGENPPPPSVNHEPSTPNLSAPANNSLCIDNSVNFQWSAATDSDGDAITYQIQTATDNAFSQNVQPLTDLTTNEATITLDKGVTFYWRVKAVDSKNASSNYSSVYKFYTEGIGETNHAPFAPELVSPALNAAVSSANPTVTLTWSAADVDTNDTLTYDVFFDTNENPTTQVATGQSALNFNANIAASTTYYWRVVVKDNQGGQAIGQVWNFSTD